MIEVSLIPKLMIRILLLALIVVLSCSPQKQRLVWSDEFNDLDIDATKWNVVVGNGCPELCGFGNNELQYYRRENLREANGKVIMTARKDSVEGSGFTSVKITTEGKGDWQYGRVEVRAKLPFGTGTWPAIWMLPTLDRDRVWPDDGEIDIMEHVGYNQGMIYGTIHTKKFNHLLGTEKNDSILVQDAHENFHVYALEWNEKSLSWFVDDALYLHMEKGVENEDGWPFDKKYHLILNLAVGGSWGGRNGVDEDIWPQTMEIDYVRVYQ